VGLGAIVPGIRQGSPGKTCRSGRRAQVKSAEIKVFRGNFRWRAPCWSRRRKPCRQASRRPNTRSDHVNLDSQQHTAAQYRHYCGGQPERRAEIRRGRPGPGGAGHQSGHDHQSGWVDDDAHHLFRRHDHDDEPGSTGRAGERQDGSSGAGSSTRPISARTRRCWRPRKRPPPEPPVICRRCPGSPAFRRQWRSGRS